MKELCPHSHSVLWPTQLGEGEGNLDLRFSSKGSEIASKGLNERNPDLKGKKV